MTINNIENEQSKKASRIQDAKIPYIMVVPEMSKLEKAFVMSSGLLKSYGITESTRYHSYDYLYSTFVKILNDIQIKNKIVEVAVVQDDDCHWYVIPFEMRDEFYRLMDSEDEFIEKFSIYMTDGGPNNVQLYAKLPNPISHPSADEGAES